MSSVVIQDSWDQDDPDFTTYLRCRFFNNIKILPKQEILKLSKNDVFVLFADSSIAQELVGEAKSCYPTNFSSLYGRNIYKKTVEWVKTAPFPFFCKPFKNDKSWDGLIVCTKSDR